MTWERLFEIAASRWDSINSPWLNEPEPAENGLWESKRENRAPRLVSYSVLYKHSACHSK